MIALFNSIVILNRKIVYHKPIKNLKTKNFFFYFLEEIATAKNTDLKILMYSTFLIIQILNENTP